MGQREKIVALLQNNGEMTQSELAEYIYGDKLQAPNIYSALMSLINNNIVTRVETFPAKYFLCNAYIPEQAITLRKTVSPKTRNANVQKASTMSPETAVQLIWDYFNETIKDEHGRYLSWRHCYKAFYENRNSCDNSTTDYLALQLAFYLASWGMYRGSSFLLQKDYKVHIPIVKIIQEQKYNPLHGISAEELCKENSLILLDDIGVRIKDCYAKESPSFDGIINNATDTLVTKILLGTLGCVPAYDRYYVQSVKKHHISSGTFNRQSVYLVSRFYCENLDKFEKLRYQLNKCGIEYPPMKLMDMCFWQDAYIDDVSQQ